MTSDRARHRRHLRDTLLLMAGLTLAMTAITLPRQAEAASFDCKKAGGRIERLICGDPSLSELDDLLQTAYLSRGRPADDGDDLKVPEKVVTEQKRWLATRNACRDAGCLETLYEQRIAALSSCPSGGRGVDELCEALLAQAERALQRVERRMDAYLAKAFTDYTPDDYVQVAQEAFRAGEQTWRDHRDAECSFVPLHDGMSYAYTGEVKILCQIDMTRRRRREVLSRVPDAT
ncbi:lysozyme inhibitor LprI family protein [Roseateles noduli]|uniref:lysozyme inhibitor LprI family protein n=1 Tax=Roseateles noduli TaxID=2052484 RepID=UPI003D65F54A